VEANATLYFLFPTPPRPFPVLCWPEKPAADEAHTHTHTHTHTHCRPTGGCLFSEKMMSERWVEDYFYSLLIRSQEDPPH
jgi:hypothetical protein